MKSVVVGSTENNTEHRGTDDNVELVARCLGGEAEAWTELVNKYKNLIYSIPIRYGFSRDEAADIFQEVCVKLLSDLGNVRDPRALPKWIIQVTSHKCYHQRIKLSRFVSTDSEENVIPDPHIEPDAVKEIERFEQDQMIREVLSELSPRCSRLVQMLFFEEPARSYRDIASSLGIAMGSIGIMRQRCIQKMRKRFREVGIA